MSAQGNAPIIIKKVKKGGGDGHHGGAWKVAISSFPSVMRRFPPGLEVRPLRAGSRVILTSADLRFRDPRHPLRMRMHHEAEVLKER